MVSRSEGFFVLYPVYFDSRATRAAGRRVPAARSVRAPTARAVFDAAKAAGLSPVLEDEHHHPTAWFERSGRVLVPSASAASKSEAILRVAAALPAAHAVLVEKAQAASKHPPRGKFVRKKGRRGRR